MKVRKASRAEWESITTQCDYATFFHTYEWYSIWVSYLGYEIETLIFEFDSGRKVLLPLASERKFKGLYREYFSSPAGTYGGFLFIDPPSFQEMEALKNYISNFKWISIRQNPFAQQDIIQWTETDITTYFDLSLNTEHLYSNFRENHKRGIRKAFSSGLQIREARDIVDWIKYYEIYQDTLIRWGDTATNRYEWRLFETLSNISKKNCILWLAEIDNKIISGFICFYYNYHTVSWHGSTLKDYFKYKPMHFLYYHILNDAVQKGRFKYYDLNPSGGHQGVKHFKDGFRTKTGSSNIFQNQKTPLLFFYAKVKHLLS